MCAQLVNIDQEILKKILDPEYPLLKEFRTRASGSFSHCKNVALFAENVASELNLDVLFMNACATYHDIGKMFNPNYFSENQQTEENPHDQLSPYMSYQYITRHVSDSCLILINDPNIPRQLIEVVSKHHGTSILSSIYAKVAKDGIPEDAFRYKSQEPNDIYSLILMISDCVEATSKALYAAGKLETDEDKVNVVKSIFERLKEDKQIIDIEIKLRDLIIIEERLIKEVCSTYHKRVTYKNEKDE